MVTYPVAASLPGIGVLMDLDYPLFVRVAHVFNILFISLMMRSGMEILSSFPKLYLNDHCRPGSEWLRLSRKRTRNCSRSAKACAVRQ